MSSLFSKMRISSLELGEKIGERKYSLFSKMRIISSVKLGAEIDRAMSSIIHKIVSSSVKLGEVRKVLIYRVIKNYSIWR